MRHGLLLYGSLSLLEGTRRLTLKVALVMLEITAISKWFREVLQGYKLAVTLVMFSLLHCYGCKMQWDAADVPHVDFFLFSVSLFCCCHELL